MPPHHRSAHTAHDTTTANRPVHYLSPRHVMAALIGLAVLVWAVVAIVLGSSSSTTRPPAPATEQWVAPGQPSDEVIDAPQPKPEPDPTPEPQPDTTVPEAQPEPQPDPEG